VPAARYIVEAFGRYSLVAFSEPRHGAGGTKEFLASLIRQPGFAGTIQDLAVECGNARYQDVVDRYMAGEPVARDQLKRAWEETTIASGMWLAPMYEAVLADVRAVNLTRPPGQRVRVLLGEASPTRKCWTRGQLLKGAVTLAQPIPPGDLCAQ
jgi:hypothetical protein